jgi:hypothetical protein
MDLIKRNYVYTCHSGYFEDNDIKKMIIYTINVMKDKNSNQICWVFGDLIVHLHFWIENELFKYTNNIDIMVEELQHYFINGDSQRHRENDLSLVIGENLYMGGDWIQNFNKKCDKYEICIDWDDNYGLLQDIKLTE